MTQIALTAPPCLRCEEQVGHVGPVDWRPRPSVEDSVEVAIGSPCRFGEMRKLDSEAFKTVAHRLSGIGSVGQHFLNTSDEIHDEPQGSPPRQWQLVGQSGELAEFVLPGDISKGKRTLLRAVASIANDAAAIIPIGMEIDFQEAKGSQGEAVFGGLTTYIDKAISKLVVGQTMTADDGASLGQAKIHNEVRLDILRADSRQIANTLNRDLIPFFVALNFGPQAAYPNVDMPVAEPEDVVALTTAVKALVPLGLKVSQREMRERIDYVARWEASPQDFATRLAEEHGATAKPGGGKLSIVVKGSGKGAAGEDLPPILVTRRGSLGWSISGEPRPRFGKVTASWHDPKDGRSKTVEASTGKDGPAHAIIHPRASEAEAKAAAKAKARELTMLTGSGHFVEIYDPARSAGAFVQASGYGDGIDGRWVSETIDTTFDKDGGAIQVINVKAPPG